MPSRTFGPCLVSTPWASPSRARLAPLYAHARLMLLEESLSILAAPSAFPGIVLLVELPPDSTLEEGHGGGDAVLDLCTAASFSRCSSMASTSSVSVETDSWDLLTRLGLELECW